ncbi:MAG: VWA domain-containing protein [Planctomycetes bacterium]|nr:VWA domain-containing protein [Planctomycetota bacterium]
MTRVDDAAGGSPLGAALAAAAALVPQGAPGALTVVSDGLATDGDWARARRALELRGLPVHVAPLEDLSGDVYPVRLVPLQRPRVGATARFQVELVGEGARCDLALVGPDGELARAEDVACDGRAAVVLEFEPRAPGFLPLELAVTVREGANRVTTNDTLRTTVAVDEPLRLLYLGERVARGGEELGALLGGGFDVTSWQGEALGPDALAGYDLAVVDDLSSETLGEPAQRALVDAVREGGLGLVASGGTAAFGPGGYHQAPLEELLPVEFVQKEEKRDPSTTLVVIIDTSGSMGGNRVQLAKEVARLAIRRLLPHDKVGIVEFYGAKHWAAPIQPASNAIELERALNRLDAGGGTVILPAIEEAFYGLKNVQTRYKHVLVLTDGGVESGAFEPLLRAMADDGINVSTVLIGPEAHSEFLVTLANWGKGRFYAVPNRFNLPEILLKQPASAKLPAYRPGSYAVRARGGAGWWGEVSLEAVPALAGYVETRGRDGAEVLLETVEGAHPVLATWRYGLGRVTALTTEPLGPGTEPWREWSDYGRWLARVCERTATDQREPFRFTLVRGGDELVLRAERRAPGDAQPRAELLGADDAPARELAFVERAPGVFEVRFAARNADEVRVLAHGGEGPAAQRTALVSPAHADRFAELQEDPALRLDLAALAAATGGARVASSDLADAAFATAGAAGPVALQRLWPWCALLALLAYLVELFVRRDGLAFFTRP